MTNPSLYLPQAAVVAKVHQTWEDRRRRLSSSPAFLGQHVPTQSSWALIRCQWDTSNLPCYVPPSSTSRWPEAQTETVDRVPVLS